MIDTPTMVYQSVIGLMDVPGMQMKMLLSHSEIKQILVRLLSRMRPGRWTGSKSLQTITNEVG